MGRHLLPSCSFYSLLSYSFFYAKRKKRRFDLQQNWILVLRQHDFQRLLAYSVFTEQVMVDDFGHHYNFWSSRYLLPYHGNVFEGASWINGDDRDQRWV